MSDRLKLSARDSKREVKQLGAPRYPSLSAERKKEDENRMEDMEEYKTPENRRDYLGVFTLSLLGASGILGAYNYRDKAYWVQVPYYATIVGSWGGVIWEVFGDLNGRWRDTVTSFRSANVGIVAGSILYLFIRIANYAKPTNSQLILLVSTIGSFLFSNSFLGKAPNRGALTSVAVFIACILLSIFPSSSALLGKDALKYMTGFAVSLLLAFFALFVPDPRNPKPDPNQQYSPAPPPNLTLFHLVNAIGSFASVFGLKNLDAPGGPGTCLKVCEWESIGLGIILGSALNFIGNPQAVAAALNIPSGFVWSLILRKLLKQKPWQPTPLPTPFRPSTRIETRVYAETHPHCAPLSCPSAVTIPIDQQKDFAATKLIFGIIGQLDFILPRCRLVPLKSKPRLRPYQMSQYYWNPVLIQDIVPVQTTPKLAREYFKEGQFLQYLVWFAHASNMIRKADAKRGETEFGTHVLDFDYMQKYQYKEDYLPYGGRAFFRLKESKDLEVRLDVTGVMAPNSNSFIKRKPDDWKFRQVEALISAAAFFEVVAGLHLLGIHVMMNTVPIALHNAFDLVSYKDGAGYHPFRVALNLHFFNHIFVNELTTAHLLAETSVFPQIFATTHSGLCDYLNDKYLNFEYARDAKLEERKAVVDNLFPKTSQLAVEEPLIDIFRKYGEEVVDAIYKNDREVAEDKQVQNLKVEMNKLLHLGLPERFDFTKKEGLARFYGESAYIVTVRHEVYGTKATYPGLDPSIMNGQIPRDFGPEAVDAYNSVVWIGLATAQAKFANLQQDFKKILSPISDETVRNGIAIAFDNFQYRLGELQHNDRFDYAHLRVLPIHLETGAGY